MKTEKKKRNKSPSSRPRKKDELPDYPSYPPDDDIYSKNKKEDIEQDFEMDDYYEKLSNLTENEPEDFSNAEWPGPEFDYEMENYYNEQEENGYYGLTEEDFNDYNENEWT